ncbi:MAG: RNA polymerase sigma factor [Thalassobaculum sp.]|uniref:RNA polymerase sigma factor n=1 Tax=Thalassobaculum sp. TaxID=2022740 RepID=UPI0032EDBB1B
MSPAGRPAEAAYDDLDEAELVARARRGDREAFRVIVQRSNQRLFRVARGIVRDDGIAEDVLQEVYAKALTGLDGYRGEAALQTWLTRITLNEARGRLRRRRETESLEAVERTEGRFGRVVAFPSGAAMDNPEADLARAQIHRLIEHAVDTLPEAFRLVFILRDVHGCSVQETAAALDLQPATVRTRLHRARGQLRAALDGTVASALQGAFPFLGSRCLRTTGAVLERLAPRYGWHADARPNGGATTEAKQ